MMDPNMDANGPDDGKDIDFSDLSPEDQKTLLTHVMAGKPQTPANQNAARNLLNNDPATVASMCEKLGIDPNSSDDQNMSDDEESDNAK